jgi:hypothetical protein
MKKSLEKLLIFLFTVLLMGILGGLYSLIFAGIVGGSALGLAPRFSVELVGRYVCPEGSQLQYVDGQGTPYAVNCVAQDGAVTQGMKSKAISTVIGMYFLICFIPTYIPGTILLWIFLNRRLFGFLDENPVVDTGELLTEDE